MNAPRMLVHLSDQMRHTLGDATTRPRPGPLQWPIIRELVMYWLPWPRGRVEGPPEAFVTQPTAWSEHPIYGRMTKRSWGHFCYRHF